MNEVREVHHYDEGSPSSAWLAILVITIVVAAGIMIALWQPWAVPSRTDTTIIKESAPSVPSTTVINPPAANTAPPTVINPPKTEIRIENGGQGSGTGTTDESLESATTGGQ